MSAVLIGVLTMFLAFFAYLLMAGAGIRRALEVMAASALAGLGVGILMGAIPYLAWPELGHAVFLYFAVLACFVSLARESLRRAREFVVSKSSTFEVLCLNVLAVAFGAPPHSAAFFEMFTDAGYVLLVNPFGFWLPEELDWLKLVLSLWPALIALWAASNGEQAGRMVRLVLMWWVQLIGIIWVFPASISVFFGIAEGSRYLYVEALLAAVGLVRVIMALLTLRTAFFGSQSDEEFELPKGTTAKTAIRRDLIDGMVVLALPGWVYAAGGCGVYLLANTAQHFLEPDVAITSGFFAILGASAFIEALGRHAALPPRMGWTHPLAALGLLVAGLLVLRELPLMPRYVQVPKARPEAQMQPSTLRPTPVEPSMRRVSSFLNRMRPEMPLTCQIENGNALQVRCASETWSLASLAHPVPSPIPIEVGSPLAMYTLKFLDVEARCLEIPVIVPEVEPQDILLLLFRAGASLPGQVGWVIGPEARCRHLRVVDSPDRPLAEPIILFDPGEKEAQYDRRQTAKVVVSLQRHPHAEAAIEKLETEPAAASETGEAPP